MKNKTDDLAKMRFPKINLQTERGDFEWKSKWTQFPVPLSKISLIVLLSHENSSSKNKLIWKELLIALDIWSARHASTTPHLYKRHNCKIVVCAGARQRKRSASWACALQRRLSDVKKPKEIHEIGRQSCEWRRITHPRWGVYSERWQTPLWWTPQTNVCLWKRTR